MKAIALLSGGLDSTLAAKLMQTLGLELIAVNTVSPFCLCTHHSSSGCMHGAASAAKTLGMRMVSINVAQEIIDIVKKPKHGYGSNMNPCIDCRILLFKKAKQVMAQEGARFVITGEVVGQRPMSQMRRTMELIEKEADLVGLVLRPLCAKVLAPTIPEQNGWVDREKLLAINGRGRKEQFALAEVLGIHDYPCPSGGCLLTDPQFSRRLKESMKHAELNLSDALLLKLGRHFRLSDTVKLVVGRDEKENTQLENFARASDVVFYPDEVTAGPTALLCGPVDEAMLELSARIVLFYCDLKKDAPASLFYKKAGSSTGIMITAMPFDEEGIAKLRV